MIAAMHGLKVVVSSVCSTRQRVKISDSFQWITDDVRARINGELMAMFGADDDCFVVGDTVYTTKRVFEKLKGVAPC